MGKPPAVVIIARHGARLDAADERWHLTSPTPYDPPLTYGGWTQSRALGARIASLLQAREEFPHDTHHFSLSKTSSEEDRTVEAAASDNSALANRSEDFRALRRKHKIIIHSSPYLRCLQTAIAVSAGISQHHRISNTPKSVQSASPVLAAALEARASPQLDPIPEPGGKSTPAVEQQKPRGLHPRISKTHLRVDAFLGEWLSPDYFEQITPPPGSIAMVTGAKAELLRRGEAINGVHGPGNKAVSGFFPGGWKNLSISTGSAIEDDGRYEPLSAMATVFGHRERARSADSVRSVTSSPEQGILSTTSTDISVNNAEYMPPTPMYAISPSDPIPAGYVAHARDACVDVDYQWDSMREPQNWANGGEYGEEWSAMHLRFRNGLQSMIDWYRTHDRPHRQRSRHHHQEKDDPLDDDFTDVVLVLVTHGAGCNALIGALTGQPVLLDIGMASLTMAVRKDVLGGKETRQSVAERDQRQQWERRRRSSLDLPISQEYDVKLVASTEHLRAGSNPLSIPRPPSPSIPRSPSISAYRHRLETRGSRSISSHESFRLGESALRSYGASVQRAASTNSCHLPRTGAGLWSSISSATSESVSESGESVEDIVPNFEDPKPASDSAGQQDARYYYRPKTADYNWTKKIPERPRSQRGLWSSAITAQERDPVPRRRWTINERH